MWRLKQFIPKDQGTLEGKSVDVGALKLQVRSIIAQGGFSCVYLARDPQSGKSYALKHIICNDMDSVDLVKKEVAVMKALREHPNVVMLHAQVVYDMGRTKECFLVMDYCERMLANVLEFRGAGYFDEKQLLLMFIQICNAVYAMHSQSPPIAHRDLKAENVLMGTDGLWKLCDFGSTSTNHKRFEKADEMGVEEDNIRKHTTPAYRAPEMWDLYQRELISEKVDIWALGCLLYRIAYFKSAFDGESKLQILNGNYRIPDVPSYSTTVTDLIKDMLTASPEARPDVLQARALLDRPPHLPDLDAVQVWQRVNDALPIDLRKVHPDKAPSTGKPLPLIRDHSDARGSKTPAVMPSRAPPLPPKENERRPAQNGAGANNAALGAFWSTQYAQDAQTSDTTSIMENSSGTESPPAPKSGSPPPRSRQASNSPPKERSSFLKKSGMSGLMKKVHGTIQSAGGWGRDDADVEGYEVRNDSDWSDEDEPMKAGITSSLETLPAVASHTPPSVGSSPQAPPAALSSHSPRDAGGSSHMSHVTASSHKSTTPDGPGPSNDPAFNAFAAQFDQCVTLAPETNHSGRNEQLQSEVGRLKLDLKQALADKAEMTSKYEKLTAICRSQRQEIQDLKSAIVTANSRSASAPKEKASLTIIAGAASSTLSPPQPPPVKLQQPQRSRQQGAGWQASDQSKDKQSGTIWDLQEGLSPGSLNRSQQQFNTWQAFGDSPKQSKSNLQTQLHSPGNDTYSLPSSPGITTDVRRRQQHSRAASLGGGDTWSFVQDSFSPTGSGFQATKALSPLGGASTASSNTSSKAESWARPANRAQPAGWAGF